MKTEKEISESKAYKSKKTVFKMKKGLLIFVSLVLVLTLSISAETYDASESDLVSGYTKDLESGDQIEFTIGVERYGLKVNAIYQNMIKIKVSQNDPKFLGISGNANPSEIKLELDFDNFYDLETKLNSIAEEGNDSLIASLTLKKIHEEIPANTVLPYSCYKAYACPNGEKIKQCWEIVKENETTACRCQGVSTEDCESQRQEKACEWQCGGWTECINGTKTRTCENPMNCTKAEPEESQACQIQQQSEKKILKFENKTGEVCLEGCTCQGVVMRCNLAAGREMVVYTSSGNTIVQVQGINMTTNVTLYKEGDIIKGNFSGNREKEIILPDRVKENIKEKIKSTLENLEMELTNEGFYEAHGKKKARLFFIIPTKESINAQVNAENGQIISTSSSWWGFLARDRKENN